ncbi:YbfB/YjiJ family MFS transporter [Allopusillimonas ginsengisoli]|uniref:YbfB/YjiJ family MFS transporter n=1 Tax=Allopusillimonas ginsengisoli TaxID=453575 RepID=UPI0014300389|nr:YbfB/YjiJ family MFS transporter [Allopusillimonas ginsengisoli]
MHQQTQSSTTALALAGFIALAVCMGIGRFAFTPLLPMMQQDADLQIAQAGWLASANYFGYLAGALVAGAIPWETRTQLRVGLWLVVITTGLMALGHYWPLWAVWRFIAGVASAIGLVAVSTLCLSRLAALGQPHKAGLMFTGVGFGIALAGLLCMGLSLAHVLSATAWLVMAAVALLGLVCTRWLLAKASFHAAPPASDHAVANSTTSTSEKQSMIRHARLIFCYGCFGFGYILPATFLPAQARLLVSDPSIFGLAWPLFGLAAAASTLIMSRIRRNYSRRAMWVITQLVMALGVLIPALWSSVTAIVIAALCVGGTFMVVTMMGMQEAQIQGGANARQLIAAVTAAFATGQLAGPVVFSLMHDYLGTSLEGALVLGCAILLLSCALLLRPFPALNGASSPIDRSQV